MNLDALEFIKNNPTYNRAELMVEFAKLHVKAALEAAHKNMQLPEEDLEFTLSSYPLNLIK